MEKARGSAIPSLGKEEEGLSGVVLLVTTPTKAEGVMQALEVCG